MNSYPTVRGFTAIGTGGDDFVHAMVVAVESVLQQPVPEVNAPFCLLKFIFIVYTSEAIYTMTMTVGLLCSLILV